MVTFAMVVEFRASKNAAYQKAATIPTGMHALRSTQRNRRPRATRNPLYTTAPAVVRQNVNHSAVRAISRTIMLPALQHSGAHRAAITPSG